jgi:hypothetical protein
MKKGIWFLGLAVISILSFSQKPFQATLYFVNGSERTGYAELVGLTDNKFVNFRENLNSRPEKIPSASIKKIIYDNDEEVHEYDNLMVYTGMSQKKSRGPYFLKLQKGGYASLYKVRVYMTSTNGATIGFDDYYVIREDESAAKLISSVSSTAKNKVFRNQASKYFSDYHDLAMKIKQKIYTWKDIEKVVEIYNIWAEENKN